MKQYHFFNMKYFFCFLFILLLQSSIAQKIYRDNYFSQEYHEGYLIGKTPEENEVRSIAVDSKLNVWIATPEGVLTKKEKDTSWNNILPDSDKGPAYAVEVTNDSVWLGTWKGVYRYNNNRLQFMPGTQGPVSVVCAAAEGVYALGPNGVWLYANGKCLKKEYSVARSIRDAISDNNQGLWMATDVGLYHCTDSITKYYYQPNTLISAYVKGVAFDLKNKLWAGGLGGVSILKDDKKEKTLHPSDGIPSIYVNCLKLSPDGDMWIGTHVGVVRFSPNGDHTLRFTRRWLLNDEVNDIAFDTSGNAWIATAGGVSAIKKRKMNLAEKQDYFYDVLMKRHIRDPWIAGQCHLTIPGDVNSYQPEDDDNDGEYTGNYLAMESFRYATTKSEDAKLKAKKAFDFLKKLQDVTGSNGFFARTIVPIGWGDKVHDGNRKYTPQQLADELVKEPRFKPIEERWHKSTDGKWLWKGDASSDEMCGHMFGYFFYYKLVADEEEKKIIRKHVASIVDHLIENNFNMMDVDGQSTRWAVWSPDKLNHDPEWMPDKNQNSMEMLAFLKFAYSITGNEKYQQHYLYLINKEHYLENLSNITHQNPAWFIYFDVILQAYIFPILIKCENDPKLLSFYQQQMDEWMEKRRADKNPLINFLYCYTRDKKKELSSSIAFLKDTPLDLIDWTVDHTKREDIKIFHQPVLDELQVNELPPASIRSVVRWDKNPWAAVNGYPDKEREPVFWLLPYWIGRYLQMIQ